MNLERGFRRLFIVLSVVALGAGIAMDAGKLWSHARIYAKFDGGHTEVLETWSLVGSSPYEKDPATRHMVVGLLREAADLGRLSPDFLASIKLKPVTNPKLIEELEKAKPVLVLPDYDFSKQDEGLCPITEDVIAIPRHEPPVWSAVCLGSFRVVRGPSAWSWRDVQFTPIATGIVLLLWIAFFAVRWVGRGFTSQPPP